MNHWDQAYSDVEGYKYGEQPNAFLKEQAHRIPPRARVLLPGDGEGRNGVWLAEQGHQVCALDNSAVGLAKAEALAHRRQVTLQTVLVDLADWQPEPASADAVVLTYLHLPPPLRTPVMHKLVQALKPGGVLGVVDHRAKPGTDIEVMKKSGYLTEQLVIDLATKAGFVLDARSEVNANPKDTADHPNGVWTLPPVNRHDAEDDAMYQAIGESDRMTLRFVKPAR